MAAARTAVQEFATILAQQKTLTEAQSLSLVDDFSDRSIDAIVDFLLEEGLADKEQVLQALSAFYKTPFLDVSGYLFEHNLVHDFPVDFLKSHCAIPMSDENDIIVVITNNPNQEGLKEKVEQYTDSIVECWVGIQQDIFDAIEEFSVKAVTEDTFEADDQLEDEENNVRDQLNNLE